MHTSLLNIFSIGYKDDFCLLWNEKKLHWKYLGRETVQSMELGRSGCFAVPLEVVCSEPAAELSFKIGKKSDFLQSPRTSLNLLEPDLDHKASSTISRVFFPLQCFTRHL